MLVNNVRAYKELIAKSTGGSSTNAVKGKYGFKIEELIRDLQSGRTKKLEILRQKMKCEETLKGRLNYFKQIKPKAPVMKLDAEKAIMQNEMLRGKGKSLEAQKK